MVIDKKKKSSEEDELSLNYFVDNYLGCTVFQNERDMTKTFVKATEEWTRNNIIEDAEKAEGIRSKIKNKLKEEEIINIEELSRELFNEEEPILKDGFTTFVEDMA